MCSAHRRLRGVPASLAALALSALAAGPAAAQAAAPTANVENLIGQMLVLIRDG
jgi:hypothetical protein